MKKLKCLMIMLLIVQMAGCASDQVIDSGIVVNQMKLKDKDYTPHASTDKGALVGGGVGAATGAALGVGLAAATFGLALPLVPVLTAAGGAAGGATGAAAGYTAGVVEQGQGLYDYVVKLDKDGKVIVVQQYAKTMIPNGTPVDVMQKEGVFHIVTHAAAH